MKIKGLIFPKLHEEFTIFSAAHHSTGAKKMTEEEYNLQIEGYYENILHDSLEKMTNLYERSIGIQLNNQRMISEEMRDSFQYFFAYLNTANEVFENARKYLMTNPTVDSIKYLIVHYGMALRLASQIGDLLLNGYPDGALRIWRSMYEYTAITLLLIKERDNKNLHQKFIDHYYRNKKRKIESLQKNHRALNFPPPDDGIMSQINIRMVDYLNKYGEDFLKEDYSWCEDVFDKRKIRFRDIEERVGIERFRPYYIWACGYTHPGFESLLDFYDKERHMLVLNKINSQELRRKSFIDPLQLTISLLHEVNIEFLSVFSPEGEYEVNLLMFREIFTNLIASFGEDE